MWDQNDKNGFISESDKKIGQVKDNTLLATIINTLCNEKNNKTFLEIGT